MRAAVHSFVPMWAEGKQLFVQWKGIHMPYDQSLDVSTFKEVLEFGNTRITVGVFSYNGAPKKLQLTRENQTEDGQWRFTKLGRLAKDEAQAVVPLMMRAIEIM